MRFGGLVREVLRRVAHSAIRWSEAADLDVKAREEAIRKYLQTPGVKRLQLGSGAGALSGWLSTDLLPPNPNVVYLDVTKRFPFPNGTFDYIFSEHLIEHVSWHQGLFMLGECRRVMSPRGTIRIATPDLGVYIAMYGGVRPPRSEEYIRWMTDLSMPDVGYYRASFIINNAFRNWGHQFLYDRELLRIALSRSGFVNVRECTPQESLDENLRGIELHGKLIGNEEMTNIETMVFEADCPA